ncbi:HDIG domain-containing protein [Geothrix limicola]|uniref:HDIG domain-containing protein n=1 Tax=Geothrix limicola TaxID=2927978 RepID=A0ABQ5QCN1_9BACT|nr:HD domain-containing protein [Geothrix limicola]GLH72211.1 HDIG domain-containing protein [Geothrix limicola]
MLTRDEAWQLLCDWTPSDKLRVHARAVELVMRDLATGLDQDVERFGLAGLLHDADYDSWPEEHPRRIVAWLRARGDEDIAHAISAHYTRWQVPYESLLDKALLASDEITGFVMACALVRPTRTEGLEPKSVKKKLKDKAFAAGVDRFEVAEGLRMLIEAIGGTEDEHLARIIGVLHAHRGELGLN